MTKKVWYERLNDHPCYDPNITQTLWENEVINNPQFEWVLDNVQYSFGIIFCDYYYIICFTSKEDAAFFKLVWA